MTVSASGYRFTTDGENSLTVSSLALNATDGGTTTFEVDTKVEKGDGEKQTGALTGQGNMTLKSSMSIGADGHEQSPGLCLSAIGTKAGNHRIPADPISARIPGNLLQAPLHGRSPLWSVYAIRCASSSRMTTRSSKGRLTPWIS